MTAPNATRNPPPSSLRSPTRRTAASDGPAKANTAPTAAARRSRPPTMYNFATVSQRNRDSMVFSMQQQPPQPPPIPNTRIGHTNSGSNNNNNNNNSSGATASWARLADRSDTHVSFSRQRLPSAGQVGSSLRRTIYSLTSRSGSTTELDVSRKHSHFAPDAAGADIRSLEHKFRNFSSTIDLSLHAPAGPATTSTGFSKQSTQLAHTDLSTSTSASIKLSSASAPANPGSTVAVRSARSSTGFQDQPIIKEGYLSKKASGTGAGAGISFPAWGWKVYRVTLRGAKLFFYKPPSESQLRGMLGHKDSSDHAGRHPPDAALSINGADSSSYNNNRRSDDSHSDDGCGNGNDNDNGNRGGSSSSNNNNNNNNNNESNRNSNCSRPSSDGCSRLPLSPDEIDSRSRPLLFESTVRDGDIIRPLAERYMYGECFSEVDSQSFKFKRYVCVLIFDDTVVVLKRRWVKRNIAASFLGAVSNKMRLSRSFTLRRSRASGNSASGNNNNPASDNASVSSIDLTTQVSSKGYFTKWQHHASYPIQNIDIVAAASSKFGLKSSITLNPPVRSSQSSMYSLGNESVSSIMTMSSTMSKDYSSVVASGVAPGFHMFVSGRERCTRMFVATNTQVKQDWINNFNSAKAAFERNQYYKLNPSSRPKTNYNSKGLLSPSSTPVDRDSYACDSASDMGSHSQMAPTQHGGSKVPHRQDQNLQQHKPGPARLYWGTDKHPALNVAKRSDTPLIVGNQLAKGQRKENDEVVPKHLEIIAGSAPIVVAGSKSALVHELVFQNTEAEFPGSDFVRQFVATCSHFIKTSELVHELEHYCQIIQPDIEEHKRYTDNLVSVISLLAEESSIKFSSSDVDILRRIVNKVWPTGGGEIGGAQDGATSTTATELLRVLDRVPVSESKAVKQRLSSSVDKNGSSSSFGNSARQLSLDSAAPKRSSAEPPKRATPPPPPLPSSKLHPEHPLSNIEELSRLSLTGLTPTILMKIQPQEIARQLYFYHDRVYRRFRLTSHSQLYGMSQHKQQGQTPQPLLASIAEPHFLTRLVHHHLLIDVPADRPGRRGMLLLYWVRVGEACRAIGDATSWASIAIAVTNPAIARLRETWQNIPLPWKMLIVREWVPRLIPYGLYSADLGELTPKTLTTQPLRVAPDAAHSHIFSSIPYFGPIKQSVQRAGHLAYHHAKTMISNNHQYRWPAATGPNHIIFLQYAHMYELANSAIKSFADSWAPCNDEASRQASTSRLEIGGNMPGGQASSSMSPTQSMSKHSLYPHSDLQKFFEHLNASPPLIGYKETKDQRPGQYDVQYLLSLSLKCEPAMSEQYHQTTYYQMAGGIKSTSQQVSLDQDIRAAPNSILPLVCPEIVPSTNVLQWIHPITRDEQSTTTFGTVPKHNPMPSDADPAPAPSVLSPDAATIGLSSNTEARSGTGRWTITHKRSRSFPDAATSVVIASEDEPRDPTEAQTESTSCDGDNGGGGGSSSSSSSAGDKLSSAAVSPTTPGTASSLRLSSGMSPHLSKTEQDRYNSLVGSILYAANGELALRVLRIQYARSQKPRVPQEPFGFLVEVQGGALAVLMDLLINDIKKYEGSVTDVDRNPVRMADGRPPHLTLNHSYAYRQAFLSSYRGFCAGQDLIAFLRIALRSLEKKNDVTVPLEQRMPALTHVLGRIIDFCSDWITYYLEDFLEDLSLREALSALLGAVMQVIRKQRKSIQLDTELDENARGKHVAALEALLSRVAELIPQFIFNLLSPSGYSPMDITLERQLKRALKCEREEGRSTIVVSRRPLDDLARLSPRDTLVTLNRLVQTHFARCTLYDWMMTYCLLEVQTHAPLPWYPVRRPRPNPSEDDLIISDIYRVLYQTVSKNYPERGSMMLAGVGSVATSSTLLTATATPSISATNLSNSGTAGYATGAAGLAPGKASEGGPNQAIPAPAISGSGSSPRASLWEQLPNAIKVLLDLHRIIRHWVTRQVSDPDIDIEERVARISKFIQIIRMCRFSKNESGSHAFKDALDAYLGRIKSLPMVTTLDLPENVTASTAAGTTKHASVSSTTASAQARPSHYVPSFVERAIASGLVSPESRRFVRAWNLVAFENGTAMGSLDALLQFPEYPPMPGMETKQDSLHVSGSDEDGNNAALPSFAVKEFNVPCVGWLLENMISLCYDTPDRLPNDERLINMAKRQRMHILTSVCDQMTVRCQKNFTLPTPLRLDLTQLAGYLIKEPLQYDAIRHAATKENSGPPEHELCSPRASKSRGSQSTDVSKPSSSSVFRRQSGASTSENSAVTVHARSYHGSPAGQWTSSHHNHHSLELSYLERPFSRLVADELEKVRQEHVERDNLERLIREREMELDRQTQERNKLLRRQLKEDKQRRARNETLVKMSTLMSRVNLTDGADGSTAASRRRRTEFISGSLHNGNTAGGRKSTSSASVKPALVINLINSVINAKEDYTKRDFVFHIVTEEGGEYLLQAPSEAEMELWIEAMRDAAAEAAARRLTVFVEEANSRSGYPAAYSDAPDGALLMGDALATATSSPVSPASNALAITPVDPVFGVPIEKLMPDPDVVPRFFEKCLAEIEKRGLDEVGIYRVSGSASGVNRLRMRLNQNSQSVDLSLPEYADINVVSGVVKLFLRELPEPLLTFDLYESLIEAINTENYDDRMWALKDTIHRLPKTNYTLLKRLIEHLEKVTDFEQINHMYSTNLALVFGPSLLRPPPSSSSFAHAMSNLGQAQSIVKNLILQYHWIFDIEQEVEASEDHDIADEVPAEADVGARPEKEEEEGSAGEANHGQPEKMSQRQSPQSVPSGDGLLKQQSGPHTAPTTIVQIGSGATEANVEGVVIPQPRNPTMTARQGGAPAGGEGCGDYSAESQTTAMSQPPEEVTHSPLHSTGSRSSTKSPKTASGALGASNAPSLTDESRTLGRMLRSKSMRRIRQAAATTASMFKPSSGNIDLKHYPLPLNTHTDDAALPNTSGFRPHSDQ